MSIENNNQVTSYAALVDKTFGFSAAHGGSVELISAGSQKATSAASQILSSIGHAGSIGREALLTTAVAASASLAALGDFSPAAIGVGAMAGVISSVSKGRS